MDPQLRSLFGRTAARVAVAEEMPVGARLHLELEALSAAPMDAETSVRVHALWAKVEAHAAARKMVAGASTVQGLRDQLWQPQTMDEAEMLAAQELACANHVAYPTARHQLSVVQRISQCLPLSWEALDRGDLSAVHVAAIERETRTCRPEIASAVDGQVVPLAIDRGWTPSEVVKAVRKLVLALDPKGAAEREESARNAADVRYYPQPDGVGTLVGTGDASLVRRAFDVVNKTAELMGRAGDERPVGVRRVDALVAAILGSNVTDTVVRPGGEVIAHVNLTTLAGLDDHPGDLVGHGPVSADYLRRLAGDARLRRLVTDPLTGQVVDLGRRAYAPSARLRKAVQATNPTCTAPGCGQPAIGCEIDHRVEYDRGGRTDQCNLKPLCKLHHDLKTRKRWKVDQNPDGSETWTSYLGFTYTRQPRHFPLPDPPAVDDEPPPDIADRLPDSFDPDPPRHDDPLPQPPRLTEEQYEEMEHALTFLDLLDISFREWCDKHYDEARATGLVA
jgi:hypothetical protein